MNCRHGDHNGAAVVHAGDAVSDSQKTSEVNCPFCIAPWQTAYSSLCIMSTSKNVRWLYNTVEDEETAVKFLREKGLLHSERLCPFCGEAMRLGHGGMVWCCFNPSCRRKVSIRRGTWFEAPRNKLKFQTAVEIMFFWSRGYTSMQFYKDELGLNKNTTFCWNRHLRYVAAEAVGDAPVLLGKPSRTQLVKSLSAQAKRRYELRQIALQLQLCEFMWRNRLGASDDAFDAILSDILRLHPPRLDASPTPIPLPSESYVEAVPVEGKRQTA
ncbi:hypothetical protein TTRE_0000359401 [Trichuris trichiura]|uniref:Uncharacterized protein n=1 Tax=Trichuris trichiura TaxID=36087 RepID=A0A077Z4B5_TRITR|nr:hypothetical protein TTRE_0000359401 [Trichuris trichiura]